MKKVFSIILSLIVVFGLCSCGCENNGAGIDDATSVDELSGEMPTVIPNDVLEGSAADIAVREVVSDYLDTFISCDFDKIKEQIHKDDAWLFNFESEDQMLFYKTIFPKITYEFEFVSEHDGVYGVMTRITSPDMAEVYGRIITEYVDTSISADGDVREIVENNTERMIAILSEPDLKRRDEKLYIYVEYIDGKYIPRCDFYLANELTGGAPEASDEITSTINSSLEALSE